ncbi:MAG: LPS export ABC transporter periplasmic protein LptC [Pseudomonadota bacterium]
MIASWITPRRALVFLLLLLLVMMSWWLRKTPTIVLGEEAAPVAELPDYIIKRFELRVLDQSGALRHQLGAQQMEHYPRSDTVTLTAPRISLHRDAAELWVIEAQRGRLDNKQQLAWLEGEVGIYRMDQDGGSDMEVRTAELQLNLQDKVARTDQPVYAQQAGVGKASAASLRLDLRDDRLELTKQVQFIYETQTP